MNLLKAYQLLEKLSPTFSTNEAVKVLNVSANYTKTILSRLAKKNIIIRLSQGKWAYSDSVDPLLLPSILAHPMLAYISLYSALYLHGMIEQITDIVFAISNGKTKMVKTPLATISIHSIAATLFTDYEPYGKNLILVATPEKALFDTLYLLPTRTNLFKRLTELELPENFQFDLFDNWLEKVKNKGRRTIIENELNRLYLAN